jgi:hypothetical protein
LLAQVIADRLGEGGVQREIVCHCLGIPRVHRQIRTHAMRAGKSNGRDRQVLHRSSPEGSPGIEGMNSSGQKKASGEGIAGGLDPAPRLGRGGAS